MGFSNKPKNKGRFAGVPRVVMLSKDYCSLCLSAKALLFEFAHQFNGSNNGNLAAAPKTLKERGVGNPQTVLKAAKELRVRNLITLTRQGIAKNGQRSCSLFAINWQPIQECLAKDGSVIHHAKLTRAPPRHKWSLDELTSLKIGSKN